MEQIWERVRAGKHTALMGISPGEPPPSLGVRVVRVRCDVPPSMLGPLHEARRKVERLLGSHAPVLDHARDRMVAGLRRRLLGDVPGVEADGPFVAACNRLAASPANPAALVFEAVDAADDATLATLCRILERPGRLALPLVLAFRGAELDGAAARLLSALERSEGPGSVLRAPAGEDTTAAPSTPLPDLRALPHEVLRVLRAGALMGSGFEVDLVAALLEMEPLAVLDLMQRAADAGVPVEDRGEARFHLPAPVLDALRASMLPSLMIALHRRLAELLGSLDEGQAAEVLEDRSQPPPIEAPPAAPVPGQAPEPAQVPTAPAAGASAEVAPIEGQDEDAPDRPQPGAWPYAEIFGASPLAESQRPVQPPFAEAATMPASSPAEGRPRAPVRAPDPGSPTAQRGGRVDDARAAGHLAAAGDLDASAERYLAAARRAAEGGAPAHAIALAQKVRATLEALPESPRRRRLRAAALLEIGRLRWLTATPESTLADAVEALDAARAALREDDPPELQAEASALIAGVCYDVGDAASLARALDELTRASRLLLDAGDPTGAARLLNDQAAVYVRMGDPVRAAHLLSESRGIFESRAEADPGARVEMAETDHLFARIPLHVKARPGREGDALTMGLDHALAAERTYQKIGARRELGRVWETMGRLELRKGRLERSRARLVAALEIEEAIGDRIGLARTTAAFSELLSAAGEHEKALSVLGDSVALNLEKGSPIGLAYNRRALDALARSVEGAGHRGSAALGEVQRTLAKAEAILGRMTLPGEAA